MGIKKYQTNGILILMVDRDGFEPSKLQGVWFTVKCVCPLRYLSIHIYYHNSAKSTTIKWCSCLYVVTERKTTKYEYIDGNEKPPIQEWLYYMGVNFPSLFQLNSPKYFFKGVKLSGLFGEFGSLS